MHTGEECACAALKSQTIRGVNQFGGAEKREKFVMSDTVPTGAILTKSEVIMAVFNITTEKWKRFDTHQIRN